MTHSNMWVNRDRIKSGKQRKKKTAQLRVGKKRRHSQRKGAKGTSATYHKGSQSTFTRQGSQPEFDLAQVVETIRTLSNHIDLPKIKQQLSQVNTIVQQVDDVIRHIRQWRNPAAYDRAQQMPYYSYPGHSMMPPHSFDPRRKR
jgi:hypothetical protein